MATRIVMVLLGLTLILAVACGSAAEPTAVPNPTVTQAASTAPVPAGGDTPQPTSTPQMAAPPAEVEVNPGKLTIMVGDLASERFDNVFLGGVSASANYLRVVGGYLASDSQKKEMLPGIASQWGLSADGLTWTFTIRKGVKFHDGKELTAEDVLWTLQHYFGSQAVEYALTGSGLVVSRAMDRIELSGPDKVSVVTKGPINTLTVLIAEAGDDNYPVMPKRAKLHDLEEEAAYDLNPIGAGPMRLVGHTPAQVMEFERFDEFYYQPKNGFSEDRRVNFQSLDLLLVPEESTRVAAIRSGEVDIAPISLAAKEQVEKGGGRLVFGSEGVYLDAKLMGCYEPQYPCHDKRVRQALDYAIDKELIRDQLYGPEVFQVKGWAVVTPSTIGYTPELDPWPFDPNKARQLMADAGYPGGKNFGKLILNTYASNAMPLLPESAQLAADFWKRELGLDVEVHVGDSVSLKEREVAGELKGQMLWRDNGTRINAATLFDSGYGDPKYNRRLHEDPELFRLVQETLGIVDEAKREEASKKMHLRLRDESYNLGIGYVNIPWGVGPRVLTWEPYPLATWSSALHTITLK